MRCPRLFVGVQIGVCASLAIAQPLSSAERTQRLTEHLYGGAGGLPVITFEHDPADYPVLVKRGHVLAYRQTARIPMWVAYRVEPSFRDTPPRKSRFKSFRKDADPLVVNAVVDDDYNGLFGDFNLARGHMAPYAVMGGERGGDPDRDAELDSDVSDPYDERTVFDANTMTNIAPQYHDSFNGSPGVWYRLERWLQDCVARESGESFWVLCGPVLGPGETWLVGADQDLPIPHMFFKVVVLDDGEATPTVLAFLMPHHGAAHGQIEDFLVSVDVIEGISGLDLFSHLPDETEDVLEETDTFETWVTVWDRLSQEGACDPGDGAAQWRFDEPSVLPGE